MRKSTKLLAASILFGTAGLNLAIDANGRINLGTTKVGAQSTKTTEEKRRWQPVKVSCLDDDGDTYDVVSWCARGMDMDCHPESCPPPPTKTNPPKEDEECE